MMEKTRIILVYKGEIKKYIYTLIYGNIRYRTETHIHRHGTKLLVRATEQNNYTRSILVLGKVEFQKSFLE